MSRQTENLKRLALIAGLKRDAESQSLAKINAEIQSLQTQVARLRKILRLRSRDLELDPSRLSGADVQWVRRTEQQIAALQIQIARAYSRRESLADAAKLAVGRAQVVEKLVEQALKPKLNWD